MGKYIGLLAVALAVLFIVFGRNPKPAPVPNHLIMLTETKGGEADASFMTVKTQIECEERADTARKVFPVADIKYIAHYCAYSNTRYEPFLHNPEPSGPNYIFGLVFSKDRAALKTVTLYSSMQKCKNSKKKTCVISYQNLLP